MVSLRLIDSSDTANIVKWRNLPNVQSNFIFQDNITVDSHENWIKSHIKKGKAIQFIIVTEEYGDIGTVYLRDINEQHRKAEFGIFIGEDYARGKGYGTMAARLILQYAFAKLNLNKVFLRVFSDNIGAIKSYESVGFLEEGYFIEDVIIKGAPKNMVFMAILQSQYNYS